MTSILITGGSGSFGNAFVRHLLANPLASRICVYSRGELRQSEMRQQITDPRMRWMIGDVRDLKRLTEAMAGIDVVVHAAALKRVEVGMENPVELMLTNCIGTANVVSAAEECEVKSAVLISTDKAFHPINTYGKTKAIAEDLFLSANRHGRTKFSVVRYGNVWRSNGSVVPQWAKIIASGQRAVPVTDPACTRFFMRMREAISLVLRTANSAGGELNIQDDLRAYRLGDLAEAMDAEMIIGGLPAHEKMHESMCEGVSSDNARRMTVDELRSALCTE